jgi:dihydrodipicolinate synthase/N-acetylneuraminate lyase
MVNTNDCSWKQNLDDGCVIPALPLTLHEDGKWSEKHQTAVLRYYIDAGVGGIAVGVHSTQFEIREPQHGLFEPVLQLASDIMDAYAPTNFIRIAGICGKTEQASAEAELAASKGYHAGLLSLAAFSNSDEANILKHVEQISRTIPVVGFYLQPAVGGLLFSFDFWKRFCEIQNIVAIKIAPFNRYFTWDVIRAVIESGRDDIALYTGNDDNIIGDLITPFTWQGKTRHIQGGLLGQWGVWTKKAVELLDKIKDARTSPSLSTQWLSENAALTDVNAALFDSANSFAGCIPGILEVLRRQGLTPSTRCLNPDEKLSPGQAKELDRVIEAYPQFIDDEFVQNHLSRWIS